MNQSISDYTTNSKEVSDLLSKLVTHYKKDTKKLILHLQQKHGYSYKQVGEILGFSAQATHEKYAKV